MRMLTIFAGCLALAACASAVYDSLERRGVSSETVLASRTEALRDAAAAGKSKFENAADALSAVSGLDGPVLARQIDKARAAGEDAALAAQDVRLAADSMEAASARYFRDSENELSAMKMNEESLRAAQEKLAAMRAADRALSSALGAAGLRLSPALSLYDAETAALRRNATSGVQAAARAADRSEAVHATRAAAASLASVAAEAEHVLATIRGSAS